MPLPPNLPKRTAPQHALPPPNARYLRLKAAFRRKVITPLSPEADLRSAASSDTRAAVRPTSAAYPPAHSPSTDPTAQHLSGAEARINAHLELDPLSSNLDLRNRRLKHSLAFIGQVLFWAAAAYMIIL
jgi:hypothetical protein